MRRVHSVGWETRVANCIYCGKPVGFLRKHHVACRRQHDAAAAKIPGFFVKCLDSSLSGEKFHKLAVDVAKANYIGDRELRQLAIKGLSALANRVLTKTEDDRIAEIRKPFGLGPGDLGEAGLVATDFVYAEGGSAWTQAENDPVLQTLFRTSDRTRWRPPSSDRKLFSPRNLTILSAILLAAIVGWIAWPYYSVYELATALRDGDVSVLDNRVAWDSVRRGLRDGLNTIPSAKRFSRNDAESAATTVGSSEIRFLLRWSSDFQS
jgi:hypothetical protein